MRSKEEWIVNVREIDDNYSVMELETGAMPVFEAVTLIEEKDDLI